MSRGKRLSILFRVLLTLRETCVPSAAKKVPIFCIYFILSYVPPFVLHTLQCNATQRNALQYTARACASVHRNLFLKRCWRLWRPPWAWTERQADTPFARSTPTGEEQVSGSFEAIGCLFILQHYLHPLVRCLHPQKNGFDSSEAGAVRAPLLFVRNRSPLFGPPKRRGGMRP